MTTAKHGIQLAWNDFCPVQRAPTRTVTKARQFAATQVDRLLQKEVIEPSTTECERPILLAPKKDGSLRSCIDYRRLNMVTIYNSNRVPRMDECIYRLGEATVLLTLDAISDYRQVEIYERNHENTAFKCHHALYQFIGMPFELKNAPPHTKGLCA